jgi:two-component sensor histidine kinase
MEGATTPASRSMPPGRSEPVAAWAPDPVLGETPAALALMARTMSEGFAVLHFTPDPGAEARPIYLNPALERLIGGAGGFGRFCDAIHLDLPAMSRRAEREQAPVTVDVSDPHRDVWLRLRFEQAGPELLTLLIVDRTDEQRAARRHAELFTELHHRVKNSLANAASLLKLQATPDADPRLTAALQQAANRIHAIADLHDVLYRLPNSDVLDLGVYVRDFCERLSQSLFDDGRVRLEVVTEQAIAPFEQAAPFGIILNELVTNAAKHAYPAPASGVVRVELHAEPDLLVLSVTDAGRGLAGGAERPGGLGMKLVRSLAKQLRGELHLKTPPIGAAFELRAPRVRPGARPEAERLL